MADTYIYLAESHHLVQNQTVIERGPGTFKVLINPTTIYVASSVVNQGYSDIQSPGQYTGLQIDGYINPFYVMTKYTYESEQAYLETLYFDFTIDPNGGQITSTSQTSGGGVNGSLVTSPAVWKNVLKVGEKKAYARPMAPIRTGYTLKGLYSAPTGGTKLYTVSDDGTRCCALASDYWETAVSTSNPQNTSAYKYAGPLTVYAQWQSPNYTFTLDPNGGVCVFDTATSGGDGTSSPAIWENGLVVGEATVLSRPKAPTRKGYTLKGLYSASVGGELLYKVSDDGTRCCAVESQYWSPAVSTSNPQNSTYRYEGPLTVYAQWKHIWYIYNGNAWVAVTPYCYDGNAWVEYKTHVYDGTKWQN